MKLQSISKYMAAVVVATAGILAPSQASAVLISLTHSEGLHINRTIASAANGNNVFADGNSDFSTAGNDQESFATISNFDLLAALTTALGPGDYQINSATFFAGTAADGYEGDGDVFTTTSYDHTTLTANNQPAAGTNLGNGVNTGVTTTWNVLGGVNTTSDTFLFFENDKGTTAGNKTFLVLDAELVVTPTAPEPSTVILFGLGLIGLAIRRRQRNRS